VEKIPFGFRRAYTTFMLQAGLVYAVPECPKPMRFLTGASYTIFSIPLLKNFATCKIRLL
jgi:hypothetical protein